MKKPKTKKKVNFRIVMLDDPAYRVLEQALKWHDELSEAAVGLAWRLRTKADVDGRIVLGKCKNISDFEKEYIPYDFVIILNDQYWANFNDKQRLALMDHELHHAAPKLNDECEHEEDERGRKLWRTRKHDIEEFRAVIERHGCYKSDLEAFAEAIRKKQETPLFNQ